MKNKYDKPLRKIHIESRSCINIGSKLLLCIWWLNWVNYYVNAFTTFDAFEPNIKGKMVSVREERQYSSFVSHSAWPHILQSVKTYLKRLIYQTLSLTIISYFKLWQMTCLSSTFPDMGCNCCQKVGKK